MNACARAVAGAVVAVAMWPAAGADAAILTCGQTITQDVKLTKDVKNCPGDGVVIGADHVTLDLNGHTISGNSPAGSGVRVHDHDAVRILKGNVRGFGVGIQLVRSHRTSVRRTRAFDTNVGIEIDDSNQIRLASNSQTRNGCGVCVDFSSRVEVTGNLVRDSALGIRFETGSNNSVTRATVLDGDGGISLSRQHDSSVSGSKVIRFEGTGYTMSDTVGGGIFMSAADTGREPGGSTANAFAVFDAIRPTFFGSVARGASSGFLVQTSEDAAVISSTAERNVLGFVDSASLNSHYALNVSGSDFPYDTRGGGGNDYGFRISGSKGTLIEQNAASSNRLFGMWLGPNVEDVVLRDNIANLTSVGDGIHSESPFVSIGDTTALRNSEFGISAAPGTTDLGGNRASGNGAGQCVNVACTP